MTARTRLLICAMVGFVSASIARLFLHLNYSALIGWDAAALAYMTSVLYLTINLDGKTTQHFASRENPGRAVSDAILLVGSLASLVAVTLLIFQAPHTTDKTYDTVLGLASIVISWMLIHTSFMLRYARVYYDKQPGGVDFNQSEQPSYGDFAYLAFTVGMAYQVSDTNITTTAMRRTILRHALLSYVFGTVIVATTIGALSGLV